MFIIDTIYNFKTTATKSILSSYELDCLGFRRTHIVKIDIRESNGSPFENRIPDSLIKHLWSVLGQSVANIERFRTARIPRHGLRITYKLEEAVHLPQLSENPLFDFYQLPPISQHEDHEYKLTVYQCCLVGTIEEWILTLTLFTIKSIQTVYLLFSLKFVNFQLFSSVIFNFLISSKKILLRKTHPFFRGSKKRVRFSE